MAHILHLNLRSVEIDGDKREAWGCVGKHGASRYFAEPGMNTVKGLKNPFIYDFLGGFIMTKRTAIKTTMLVVIVLGVIILATCLTVSGKKEKGDIYRGGWIWNNWTSTLSGGTGELPEGSENKDFLRCKSCHGWDTLGPDGGYVRRSGYPDKTSRPKPTSGTNLSSKLGMITPEMVETADGRALSTEDNIMPNFSQTDGLTSRQVADVVAFLNSGPKITDVATLDITQKPVKYTFLNANIENGTDLFVNNCAKCHAESGKNLQIGKEGEFPNGLIDFFRADGKYSEGFHKIIYGEDDVMTRAAAGRLDAAQVRDILAWIQTKADDPDKTALDR